MAARRPLGTRNSELGTSLLACLTLACGGASGRAAGGSDTLYIAVAAGQSATGQPYIDGATQAIIDLNRRRPPGRPPVGLRLPPAGEVSQVAVATAFRDDPRVVGVIGHTGSAQTLDAAPIYGDVEHGGKRALVAITPTATNPSVTAANPWIFRICPTDDDVARALARFTRDSLGSTRAAVIYRNDLFGRGFQRVFGGEFAQLGGTVAERDPYLAGITEFPAYATRLSKRGVDVLVVAGGAADTREIIAAVRAAGLTLPVVGTDDIAGLAQDTLAAKGTRGIWYAAFYLPSERRSRLGRVFAARFQTTFNYPPDHRAALSYDAATLIAEAAWATGGDRQAIRAWLLGDGGPGPGKPPHEGVTGPIRFTTGRNAEEKRILIGRVGA
ncbi:MAG TPA: ABC transporter substrate-binding protein [Gemmatimonadales bacterium]|nr:ABC transporter substrate-binding protein [Gemmatimonadales bacterium]